tara:strand:- start:3210 stop:3371 length:162 start_codon:yes stop_codon:yes gene_type:complete
MENKYVITKTQLKMINILIKTIEESINRKTFSEDEIKNILKTIKILNSYPNIC